MDFLALNDDVKFIISKHLASDFSKLELYVCKVCINVCSQNIFKDTKYIYMYVCMYIRRYIRIAS